VQFAKERVHGHLDCDLSSRYPSRSRTLRWLLSCNLPPLPHSALSFLHLEDSWMLNCDSMSCKFQNTVTPFFSRSQTRRPSGHSSCFLGHNKESRMRFQSCESGVSALSRSIGRRDSQTWRNRYGLSPGILPRRVKSHESLQQFRNLPLWCGGFCSQYMSLCGNPRPNSCQVDFLRSAPKSPRTGADGRLT